MEKLFESIPKEVREKAKEEIKDYGEEQIPKEEQCKICTNPHLPNDKYCSECRAMKDAIKK